MEDDSAVVSIVIFRIFIQQGARTISSVSLFTHLKVTILIPLLPLVPQSILPQFPFQISLVSSYLECLHGCLPTIGYVHRTWNATLGFFLLHLELNSNSLLGLLLSPGFTMLQLHCPYFGLLGTLSLVLPQTFYTGMFFI